MTTKTDTVTGWRFWTVERPSDTPINYRPILLGPAVESRNNDRIGKPWIGLHQTAECENPDHQSPNIECGCGVFAEALTLHSMRRLLLKVVDFRKLHAAAQDAAGPFKAVPIPPMLILGKVRLSGRIVVDLTERRLGTQYHEEFRPFDGAVPEYLAEFGTLEKLWVTGLPDPDDIELISQALQRSYPGVPVAQRFPQSGELLVPPIPNDLPRGKKSHSYVIPKKEAAVIARSLQQGPRAAAALKKQIDLRERLMLAAALRDIARSNE